MHLARAGEIVLVELPDAAWCGKQHRDPFDSPSVACAPSGSLRKTGVEGDLDAALKSRSSTRDPNRPSFAQGRRDLVNG
jgi:hypothetical protein